MRHVPEITEKFHLLNLRRLENIYSELPFCEVVADFHEFVTDFVPKENLNFSTKEIVEVMNNYIREMESRFNLLAEEHDELVDSYENVIPMNQVHVNIRRWSKSEEF